MMAISLVLMLISLKISGQLDKNEKCSPSMKRANRLLLILGVSGLVFSVSSLLVLKNCDCSKSNLNVELTMVRMGGIVHGLILFVIGIMLAASKDCGEISFEGNLIWMMGFALLSVTGYGMFKQYYPNMAASMAASMPKASLSP